MFGPDFSDAGSASTLLSDLLAVSLTGVSFLRPLYGGPAGELEDFALEYLNPTAQRITGLPERPGGTLRTHFSAISANGLFAFCRGVFETGEDGHFAVPRQAEGLHAYVRVAARRSGERLVLSFTATPDPDGTPSGAAPGPHQRPEALYQVFEQTPASIVLLRGPEHRIEYYNQAYQNLFPDRQMRGRTISEVQPDAAEQGFLALLDGVYQTGETFFGRELPLDINQPDGTRKTAYFDFTYQAYRVGGRIAGIDVFASDVTEQVLARQEREAQRQHLHQLFMQAPTPIVILDGPELVFQLVNPAYQLIFPGRRLLGKPLLAALPELADSPIPELLRRVYETGETFIAQELPLMLARHEGGPLEEIYSTFTYQARRNRQGQVDGVLVFAYEVTDQVLARRKVEESAQQVRAVVEGASFLIGVYVGPEFRIQLVNQAMTKALGKGTDIIGRRYVDVLPELEGQAVFEQLYQVFTTGQPLHLRNQRLEVVMNGQSQTFYYNYSFTPLRDTRGQVYGILNTAADVTDLMLARRRADEAAADLRLLTSHVPAFLFRTDATGHFTYLNEAYFEWTGLAITDLSLLDEIWDAVHPEDLPTLQPAFIAAVSARQPWESPVHRMRRHDGQYRWMFTRTQPLLGAHNQLVGHSGISFEVHEQVELQRQLQRTNVDLDNFIYTASHDLKAPIANIEGLLQALEHELPTTARVGDVPLMLELMQGAVERFQRTITNLTDISRLQKEHDQPRDQVQLANLIEAVRLDLMPLLQETGAVLKVEVEACPTLQFAEKNLRSIIYNLLSNALKYRHPNRVPEVLIRCRVQDSYRVLEVQDNGLGLDLTQVQAQEKLFAMFQRLHTHVEGTGVGLYMVKNIVENAGGRVEVQSQLGQGSTFAIYFPQ
ncbi:PAS domain-containing protein [Hymenobacter sp. DG01]|uniref:PAS domain-containing sensor histidine kinase n=1 Tax=Hymenobacter sp. DG01 TaxID=2584940 RepID=UPI0015DE398E|nr:PAS domain-containing protein [Hymenobacter sp. DG01]